jgi:hypothetical protein
MDFITIYLYYSTFFDKMTIKNWYKYGIENNHCTSISMAVKPFNGQYKCGASTSLFIKTKNFPGEIPELK